VAHGFLVRGVDAARIDNAAWRRFLAQAAEQRILILPGQILAPASTAPRLSKDCVAEASITGVQVTNGPRMPS